VDDEPVLDEVGLWNRVANKRATAAAMRESRQHCRESWLASGSAVEFALKACIMRRERLNSWPTREHRSDLYHHNLRRLFEQAGIDLGNAPKNVRVSLRVVLDWDRYHDYQAGRMPRKQAKEMYESAFGANGVIEWLRQITLR
jgi:HEPN domain-containing protein